MVQSSAGGAIAHFPRVPGPHSTMKGSGSAPALCPIPRSIGDCCVLVPGPYAPGSEARQPQHSSMLLLRPAKPAETWDTREVVRLMGFCCHSRVWRKTEQQSLWLLPGITRHLRRLPRQNEKKSSHSPSVSIAVKAIGNSQGCFHLAETF